MKAPDIRFFAPQDNQVSTLKETKTTTPKKVSLTGYISPAGKLVLPAKTVVELGIDVENTPFRVGMEAGKRKAKSLYLVKADENREDIFHFEKAAKSYTLSLGVILKKSGVDLSKSKYSFTIELFDYEDSVGLTLELKQNTAIPKVAYTGKPRGRKSKAKAVEE